jgi:2,4-dienoyl-CoA reductase-like NADH-dependent reductase (Old Yellow Enzyme family)
MCQYSAIDGVAQDWHLVHLGSLARGGAGLVMVEATAVLPEGRISPQDLGLWDDRQTAPLARIVEFVRQQGAVAGIQLAHAGRKGSTFRPWDTGRGSVPADQGGWTTVAPSALPFGRYAPPRAMDEDDVDAVVRAWSAAAARALDAGFDVVEIHAAHGYLLHEFLSPISNQRTDAYGGSLHGRARLLLRVVSAVRQVWPADRPLFVRFSGTDWVDGGWDVEQCATVAGWVGELGVDLVDISSGGIDPAQQIPVGPGYQVPLAAHVRAATGLPTTAVGLITEPEQAQQVLDSGAADAVMLGRAMLLDTAWPVHAARRLGAPAPWPAQYARAAELG